MLVGVSGHLPSTDHSPTASLESSSFQYFKVVWERHFWNSVNRILLSFTDFAINIFKFSHLFICLVINEWHFTYIWNGQCHKAEWLSVPTQSYYVISDCFSCFMLHSHCFIYFITGDLYLLIPFTCFSPLPLSLATTCLISVSIFLFCVSENIWYLSFFCLLYFA